MIKLATIFLFATSLWRCAQADQGNLRINPTDHEETERKLLFAHLFGAIFCFHCPSNSSPTQACANNVDDCACHAGYVKNHDKCDEFKPVLQVVPSVCQVDFLIDLMDAAVKFHKPIAAQWLRLSFHDAGTFNVQVPEGGANGCLLTNDAMRRQPENHNLDLAIETLHFVQLKMVVAPDPIRLSSADLIQFAGFFVAVRQRGPPGLDSRKRHELKKGFQWGRPDEDDCQLRWTESLPGFQLGAEPNNIPQRCQFAGREIREKMMDRNGFTAREANVLIGAHTIGLTRNVFTPLLAAPWVPNGADSATPEGPVFDNAYHKFLIDSIPATTVAEFARKGTPAPFFLTFPDWFKSMFPNVNYLDTDIAIGLPSEDTNVHPHFDTFSHEFAKSNTEFINSFMAALNKMSKLGVNLTLQSPTTTCTTATKSASPPAKPSTFITDLVTPMNTAESLLAKTAVEMHDVTEFQTTPVQGGP